MRKVIAVLAIISGFTVGAYAATVTAIDASNAVVTDDMGNIVPYNNVTLNQIVFQAKMAMQRAGQQVQMADETYLQWAHTQAVFQNEVQNNSFNEASTL